MTPTRLFLRRTLIATCNHITHLQPAIPSSAIIFPANHQAQNMSTRKPRPSRNAAAPPPSIGGLYCHTCGRIITPRKSHAKSLNTSTPPKYCSDRCRREKPPANQQGVEGEIERVFVEMLGWGGRRVVDCAEVERKVFGALAKGGELDTQEHDAYKNDERSSSSQTSDDDDDGGVPLDGHSLPGASSERQHEVLDNLTPQQLGRQRAANREKVRQAARRGAVFGFLTGSTEALTQSQSRKDHEGGEIRRRRVEAIQSGRVVEASFAKGPWDVRWKDEQG